MAKNYEITVWDAVCFILILLFLANVYLGQLQLANIMLTVIILIKVYKK